MMWDLKVQSDIYVLAEDMTGSKSVKWLTDGAILIGSWSEATHRLHLAYTFIQTNLN